ncbi:transcriptional regulator with XRE-family HTH domain [Nocardiopsis mwathae]|uniref:Transcriptional regulator with XRE-family HTH domain n=1 Tax=Nocardiopsis mwathae TaxID=1472723 RepID=A0A7W9YK91_9ACTN|nr:helix-turn-helix transcriptional regulator [Nocardiopsis mwathae]MBB6173587.1 transcriptional regulator with XRE-family HTH domain [Nocardiopsis mwathae]
MTDYQTARASLGAHLRELRGDAGLSGRALAERLGWHPSKVSKLEHGKQTASAEDLRSWAAACGQPTAANGLLAQRRSLETHYASWRRQLAGGTRAAQRAFAGLEADARRFRIFESMCVPGLLQTPAYARHIMRPGVDLHHAPDDLEDGVRTRMERQRVLDDRRRSFDIVMWEPALRMRLCPVPVMVEQLDHLSGILRQRPRDIGVIPLGRRLEVRPSHGFWIFDDTRVLVETIGAELSLTDDDAIAPYRRVFTELSHGAARGLAALRIIDRIRRDLQGERSPRD